MITLNFVIFGPPEPAHCFFETLQTISLRIYRAIITVTSGYISLLFVFLLARTLTQNEVNAKGRAVQDACLFKQSESRKRFSAFARVFKQEGTKKNR